MINSITEDISSLFWLFVISAIYLATFEFLSILIRSEFILWTFGLFLALFITRVIAFILEALMNRLLVTYDSDKYFVNRIISIYKKNYSFIHKNFANYSIFQKLYLFLSPQTALSTHYTSVDIYMDNPFMIKSKGPCHISSFSRFKSWSEKHNKFLPIELGENCEIGPYVVIHGNTKIGSNAIIGTGSYIGEDSVVPDGAEVLPGTILPDESS